VKLILDTCTILWAISKSSELSTKAKNHITDISNEIYVSAISCTEIACLSDRNRIELNTHWKLWFRKYVLNINNWTVLDLDLQIIEEAYSLPGEVHKDPVDRFLIATSRLNKAPIVTADRKILDYPHVDSIW
jgi:PIN domain nuclease of toxin-antitoxin system